MEEKPTIETQRDLTGEEQHNCQRVIDYLKSFLGTIPGRPDPVPMELVDQWVCPDVVYYDPSLPETARGIQAFRDVLEVARVGLKDIIWNIHQLFPDKDEVTVHWSSRGVAREDYPGLRGKSGPIFVVGTTRIKWLEGRVHRMWQIFQSVEDEVTVKLAISGSNNRDLSVDPLTTRENEVYHWICQGKTNEEIAIILDISPRTVEKHCQNIFQKIGVENRKAAIVQGILARTRFV